MPLTIPIECEQIAAAQRLHQRLEQWRAIDSALASLDQRFPGFGLEETLLKATCVNALYGTNVLAIHRIVRHVVDVLSKTDVRTAGAELVEDLAVPPQDSEKIHRHHSFASKFAHFFIDPNRFPIMDKYAVEMVGIHVGRKCLVVDSGRPYVAFWRNHSMLKQHLQFEVSNVDLDHYLWIAGLYLAYRKNPKAEINREVHALFESRDATVTADLSALFPSILLKAFRGKLQP